MEKGGVSQCIRQETRRKRSKGGGGGAWRKDRSDWTACHDNNEELLYGTGYDT